MERRENLEGISIKRREKIKPHTDWLIMANIRMCLAEDKMYDLKKKKKKKRVCICMKKWNGASLSSGFSKNCPSHRSGL